MSSASGSVESSSDEKEVNADSNDNYESPQAIKFARICYFAYMDHFGLNTSFLSITPE